MFCPFLPLDENKQPRECSYDCALATRTIGEETPKGYGCSFFVIADRLKQINTSGIKVYTQKIK